MTAQDYLKAIRGEPYNLTQAQVAERSRVPQGTISKIERGQQDVLTKTYFALKALHDELEAAAAAAPQWDGKDRRKEARA